MTKNKLFENALAKSAEELRLKAIMLRSQVAYHKFMYYIVSRPILNDQQFDQLEKDYAEICETIERIYPELYAIYKFRPWVGVNHTPYGDVPLKEPEPEGKS